MTAHLARFTLFSSIVAMFGGAAATRAAVVEPVSHFTVSSFNMEWFGLDGSPSNSAGSETRVDADVAHLTSQNAWSDVMAFEEIVDVDLLRTKVVGSNYSCESYQVSDPKHQHVAVCVRAGFKFIKAPDDDNFALESVAMGTLRPAVHGIVTTAAGAPLAHIVALHLKANEDQSARRLAQTELIAKYLEGVDPSLPIIILGDLNTFADDAQKMLDIYAAHGIDLTEVQDDASYTYRTSRYSSKFDRMFIRGLGVQAPIRVAGPCNLAARDMSQITAYNQSISDHCPVVADFNVEP